MRRALLANLGFEYELAARPVSRAVKAQERRFAHILRLVEGWRDAEPYDEPHADAVLAWGMSGAARALVGPAAATWPAPEIVREANSKCFSHATERRLGGGLPGACEVRSVEEFEATAAQWGGGWVLKHPFGVAGREAVRGRDLDASARAGALRLFETASSLLLEPLVCIAREYSVHFDVTRDGEVHRVGATTLLADARGTFRGNSTFVELPDEVDTFAGLAARAVAELGYRGPVGVDAFVGTLDGRSIVRPVSEINARWSFGRLTLELRRLLGRDLVWNHGSTGSRPPQLQSVEAESGPGEWLLPDWCDPAGVSGTWVSLAEAQPEIDEIGSLC